LAIVSVSVASSTLLLGYCCFPVTGVVLGLTGLALGIVSLVRVAREPNRYSGKGLAIAGIVGSVLAPISNAIVFLAFTL
jgi:putative effector of murein hydrolase